MTVFFTVGQRKRSEQGGPGRYVWQPDTLKNVVYATLTVSSFLTRRVELSDMHHWRTCSWDGRWQYRELVTRGALVPVTLTHG